MEKVIYKDLGQVKYQETWDYQHELHKSVVDQKRSDAPSSQRRHYLLFCEHLPVYTLGKSGSEDHLLLDEAGRDQQGVEYYRINRGGDITYHGPGQLIGYPIFDLDGFFTDVHKYVRFLEEAVIRTLADYGIKGQRVEGFTGVWLDGNPKRKICAIGVHLSRWVSMHGFAFNINTDLKYFEYIIPCGINDADKTVTSLSRELGTFIDLSDVKCKLKGHFADLFGFQYVKE